MSEYEQFLAEKQQIVLLLKQGLRINKVTENLSGAFVDFVDPKEATLETLHICTAEGRKYFSNILNHQKTQTNVS